WVVLHVAPRRVVVVVAGHDPLVILRGLEEPAQELARGLEVLAELPEADAARYADRVAANRPRGRGMKAGLLGHRHLLFLRHDVVADRVLDPRPLARIEPLVVRGVVP